MKRLRFEDINLDARRDLYQIYTGPIAQVNFLQLHNVTIGGHYHKIKTEIFFVVFGRLELKIYREGSVPTLSEFNSLDIVMVEPGEMHTLSGDAMLIEMMSHPYDKEDVYE